MGLVLGVACSSFSSGSKFGFLGRWGSCIGQEGSGEGPVVLSPSGTGNVSWVCGVYAVSGLIAGRDQSETFFQSMDCR